MKADDPSSAEFFERKYRVAADPWRFAEDATELGRYDAMLAALSGRRFRHAFEPGCSVGVLTTKLAGICDHVDASDFSPSAVEQARLRCAHLPNVTVRCEAFPNGPGLNDVDLLVLSEIGYYFKPKRWREIATEQVRQLPVGATVLAGHWLGSSNDHRMSGDKVHEILLRVPGLRHEGAQRFQTFRLDRWVRL